MTTTAPTETEWQHQIIDLAHIYGWHHCHTRRSIGKQGRWVTATNIIGWPDLVLWNEHQHRVLFAELKTDKGKATPQQITVLRSLAAAGAEVYLWRPADLDEIATILAPLYPPTIGTVP